MAHITGGGLLENIPRILPAHLQVTLDSVTWPRPPIFQWLQKAGQITDHEMYRTFNCGIGYVVVIAADQAGEATKILAASGEHVYEIGRVETRTLPDRPILIS